MSLRFITVQDKRKTEIIRELEVPEMEQAINAYYTITASPEFREIERLHEKARHDEAQALHHAEQQGIQQGIQKGVDERSIEIARKLLKRNRPIDEIVEDTGLTREEIENLK